MQEVKIGKLLNLLLGPTDKAQATIRKIRKINQAKTDIIVE